MPSRKLIYTSSFEKAQRKFIRKNLSLKKAIQDTLLLLEEDAFSLKLRTHKLSGVLYGTYACSCGYDCRIIFSIEKTKEKEIILLIDIGTHDEVY